MDDANSNQPAARQFGPFDLPAGRAQPSILRWIIATIVAIGASLAACALLVVAGIRLFPATAGYAHFQFADYGKFTVIGVFLACCAWPVVSYVTTRGRAVFLLLTILVSIVGFAPDAYIAYRGQPIDAVAVLVAMHIALAVITYPALVFIAPQRRH